MTMSLTTIFGAVTAGSEPAGGAATNEIIIATAMATIVTVALLVLCAGHRSGRVKLLGWGADLSARISGLPRTVALPLGIGGGALHIALLGMYWDISLHIDQGRDAGPLANPAHYLILIGLFGIFAAGVIAMSLPRDESEAGTRSLRIAEGWHAPVGGLLMAACGAFALTGFPLDDVWHRLFGQDVTLWGPTHLMLIGGAGMSLVGMAVLLAGARSETQAGLGQTLRRVGLMGGLLIGLSTFQGEFDFGVPQFRMVFHPLLIAFAAAFALTAARLWIGRGGAIYAALFFLLIRGIVSLFTGPIFGEVTPTMALYVPEALLVEAAAVAYLKRGRAGLRRRLRRAGRHARHGRGVGLDARDVPAAVDDRHPPRGPRPRDRRRPGRRDLRRAAGHRPARRTGPTAPRPPGRAGRAGRDRRLRRRRPRRPAGHDREGRWSPATTCASRPTSPRTPRGRPRPRGRARPSCTSSPCAASAPATTRSTARRPSPAPGRR